ncbi:hypothetical protein [Bradyrhizobium paxllaeri]|uniref:hypothetical protein n=1 Tax=Bradyrhizobium paxllaeri TaxID=190148 RepID=UPI0008108D5A|nr:hypothetical protein [Bradyrhizobium paxllaeri]
MANPKTITNEVAGKAKRLIGEILGDQGLHDEGNAQERQGREERKEPPEIKPLGNLDKLT